LRRGHGGPGGQYGRLNQFRWPHVDGQPPGVVEQRFRLGKFQADVGGQVVLRNLCFGLFERPRDMVDVGAQQASEGVSREEAVTLGEEIFNGPRAALDKFEARTQAAVASREMHRLKKENSRSPRGLMLICAQ